jgi:hypothetical protein
MGSISSTINELEGVRKEVFNMLATNILAGQMRIWGSITGGCKSYSLLSVQSMGLVHSPLHWLNGLFSWGKAAGTGN